MSDIISSGNKQDKWVLKVTDLLNWLNENKSAVLVAGDNITLEPQSDGTIEISASGGGGDVTDVQLDGTSILDQDGIANITSMSGATAQANGVKGLVPTPLIADKDKFLKGDGTWANASNVGALNDLSDVNISSPTDGQALKYDATNQRWINDNVGENNVDDVEVNGVSVVDSNKIAQIISYKEVTQQEYDLLSQEEKMNGVAYFIKDAGLPDRTSIYSPIIYSLEERCIGVWTDGKPLYQKTIVTQNTTINTEITIDVASLNIDTCVDIFGNYSRIVTSETPAIVITNIFNDSQAPNNNLYYSYLKYVDNFKLVSYKIQFGSSYDTTNKQVITLQYTKTTDVAGQGNWGQDGIPTVHYSADEKIIGTWFGETLYQKSYAAEWQPTIAEVVIDSSIIDTTAQIRNLSGTWAVGGYGYTGSEQADIHQSIYFSVMGRNISPPIFKLRSNGFVIQKTQSDAGMEYSITIQYTKTSS